MNADQSCGSCQFWVQDGTLGHSEAGHCRRYPPQMLLLEESVQKPTMVVQNGIAVPQVEIKRTSKGFFPVMLGSDKGCGEYREVM